MTQESIEKDRENFLSLKNIKDENKREKLGRNKPNANSKRQRYMQTKIHILKSIDGLNASKKARGRKSRFKNSITMPMDFQHKRGPNSTRNIDFLQPKKILSSDQPKYDSSKVIYEAIISDFEKMRKRYHYNQDSPTVSESDNQKSTINSDSQRMRYIT
mmetsp:Transcript_17726/g.17438  ORF Transcript_17726/g.17438 Transcript_17726/m.17438 type:complete len:159 (+) Transcript_17726:157-633(+)